MSAMAFASSSASGRGRRDRPDLLLEKAFRVVEGLRLHILAERQRHRTAIERIGQHLHGALQRRDDLLGPGDAVEIARDRTEGVVGRDRAVAEILDLLQHRIRRAIGEDVAGQEEHGNAVDMRDACRRHHIQGAGADRGRAGHEALAEARLGIGDRGMRHALFVMGAIGRQFAAHLIERFADARDVAMAEDRPDAAEDRHLLAVDDGHLLLAGNARQPAPSSILPSCPSGPPAIFRFAIFPSPTPPHKGEGLTSRALRIPAATSRSEGRSLLA